MPLSSADQARLDRLRTARDALASGKALAAVEYNGERREYAKADMGVLQREIQQLEAAGTSTGRRRGAIRFSL